METTLKVRDQKSTIPEDAPLDAYSSAETLLTVLISRDRGRALCLITAGDNFGRRVQGVCVLFDYLYEHLKKIDGNEVDEYRALKIVEEWISTAMVKAHLRTIVDDYLRTGVGSEKS